MRDSPVNPPLRHRWVHHKTEEKLLHKEMAASYISLSLSLSGSAPLSASFFSSCLPLVKSVMHCCACTFTDWFLPLFLICLSAKLSVPAPRSIYLFNSNSLLVYEFVLFFAGTLLWAEYYSNAVILCKISSLKEWGPFTFWKLRRTQLIVLTVSKKSYLWRRIKWSIIKKICKS